MSGRTIASERVKAGLTQEQLASRLHIAVGTVSNWERGRFEPTGSNLAALARLFGCTTDYLLGITEERTHATA